MMKRRWGMIELDGKRPTETVGQPRRERITNMVGL